MDTEEYVYCRSEVAANTGDARPTISRSIRIPADIFRINLDPLLFFLIIPQIPAKRNPEMLFLKIYSTHRMRIVEKIRILSNFSLSVR